MFKPMATVEPYPSDVDLAWAAGLWDGEGSVGRYHGKTTPNGYAFASLAQKDRRVIDRLMQIFPFGRVHGKGRYGVQFNVSRQMNVMLLAWMLWPHLGEVKREQFAAALDKRYD